MNIFHKVALSGLRKNRTRTLVTIIGVVLSAALFTGITTFAVSLQNYLIQGASAKYGSWHIQLPAAEDRLEKSASKDPRVSDTITLYNMGYTKLEDSKNPDKPYLFLSGWNEKAFASLPVRLLSGRLPENGSEVLIPSHLAANGGVKISIGDTVTLTSGTRMKGAQVLSQHDPFRSGEETLTGSSSKTYTAVGICQRPAIEEYSAPGYTLITKTEDAQPDSLSVFITLKNPYRIHSYIKDLGEDCSYVLNQDVLRFMGLSGEKAITILLYSICVILAVLVVIGSVFLIYNAFHISLNERTHEFGILMSVGATARQLRSSVLFEGFCISLIGIPIGILIGLPGTRLILTLVEKNFANVMYDNVPLSMVVSLPVILAAILISLLTVLLSAYIPAKKAAAAPVMECIRQTNEIKDVQKALKAPGIAGRFLGIEELLALKNFQRNRRRYRSIILSLTFSVVLFVSSNTFGSYLNQVAESSGQVTEKYDIVFSSRDIEESQLLHLYEQLKDTEGVTVSGYQIQTAYPCILNENQVSGNFTDTFGEFLKYDEAAHAFRAAADVIFVDDAAYQNHLKSLGLSKEAYPGEPDSMIMAGYVEGYLYMQEKPMELSLLGKNGKTETTVRAVYVKDYPDLLPAEAGDTNAFRGYSLLLIAPYHAKPLFDALGTAEKTNLGMTFQSDNPGRSTSRMKELIEANGITADYTLNNLYAILEQNRNLSFIVDLFSSVFVVMITLIAVANVFNTISTSIRLRRKELAMLRSVGMSDRDFSRMMRFECLLYGMRTMLWGLPLSILMICLIYKAIVLGGGFELAFIFPFGSIIASILGVFLIVFITMLYASGKIKKENIMDALRDDMT